MTSSSHPALDALSPDDCGRVTAMAAALPEDVVLSDERAVMLHLHRERFPAADIAVLAPFVVAKARELREFFGLTSIGETLAAAGFALALLSFSFLACVLDPAEADAAEAVAMASIDAPLIALPGAILIALAIGLLRECFADDAPHGLRDIEDHFSLALALSDDEFERRTAENRRRAWHCYIAMGMGGEL